MDRINPYNPFARRENYTPRCLTWYKVFTILSWLLSVFTSIYYAFNAPVDGIYPRHSIWDQNHRFRTAFTMNSLIVSLYFLVMFVFQLGYIGHLFSSDLAVVNHAASVGSHFIANNLFHFAFVMLFVRSLFGWAELLLILNFFNLSALYFRHNTYRKAIHFPAVSAPLAWTFVAIYWNGAIMVPHTNTLAARILGNIFIWSILAYGMFFIMVYRDYTMGFSLSVLSAAIGVDQFLRKIVAFQWIFAFTIMAVLFVATIASAGFVWTGQDFKFRGSQPVTDPERDPLLEGNNRGTEGQG